MHFSKLVFYFVFMKQPIEEKLIIHTLIRKLESFKIVYHIK